MLNIESAYTRYIFLEFSVRVIRGRKRAAIRIVSIYFACTRVACDTRTACTKLLNDVTPKLQIIDPTTDLFNVRIVSCFQFVDI